jgi:hypothetical protein
MISSARTRWLHCLLAHSRRLTPDSSANTDMDKFKGITKGGWHPEKNRTNSGSSGGGQSDSKLGQVVCKLVLACMNPSIN